MSQLRPYVAVVDDEPAVLKALERLLRAAKFQTATFASGAAFLASLSSKPDCVLLDLQMPGMTGFDVQSRLAAEPNNTIGVVIITAHDSPAAKQRAMAAGAAAYLRKPVDADTLLDAVRSAIDSKSA